VRDGLLTNFSYWPAWTRSARFLGSNQVRACSTAASRQLDRKQNTWVHVQSAERLDWFWSKHTDSTVQHHHARSSWCTAAGLASLTHDLAAVQVVLQRSHTRCRRARWCACSARVYYRTQPSCSTDIQQSCSAPCACAPTPSRQHRWQCSGCCTGVSASARLICRVINTGALYCSRVLHKHCSSVPIRNTDCTLPACAAWALGTLTARH
jgi:hypothetical protein